MENWEIAATDFISQCSFYRDIEAAFLTGSYAAGNADNYSDIDVYIVLNDNISWRERGNKRINGFLIEYFANPTRQIKNYIDSSYNNADCTTINMILNGIILINKNFTADKLIEYCVQKDLNCFPKLAENQIKISLYRIWDNFDELTRAYKNKSNDFTMQYYMFIINTFELYSSYICSPVPNYHHLFKWLTDEKYIKGFGLPSYKDQMFIKEIITSFSCLNIDTMFTQAGVIKTHVINKMNGFDIDNFVLRSECDC
ncbi:MAG: nucleotidyltransferase domain-containing protein [Oscillospiraceae bacterium]|nr:nucleotidyltransferase domain-containing protein [Oscillospiraceae bacterium]